MKTNAQLTTDNSQRGITLYLAMLLMSTAVTIALFVSQVFAREYRISVEVANSMKAVSIADSAMEYTLYQTRILATDITTLTGTPLTYNTMSGNYELSTSVCQTNVLGGVAGVSCKLDARTTISEGSHPGCPTDSAANYTCTRITARGAYGTTNRAMELVYKNL